MWCKFDDISKLQNNAEILFFSADWQLWLGKDHPTDGLSEVPAFSRLPRKELRDNLIMTVICRIHFRILQRSRDFHRKRSWILNDSLVLNDYRDIIRKSCTVIDFNHMLLAVNLLS